MSNALSRSEELARKIRDYQDFKEAYDFRVTERAQTKARIMRHLVATDEDWDDWRWQMSHRLHVPEELVRLLRLEPSYVEEADAVGRQLRWAINPYYATLINPKHHDCPIGRMVLPSRAELDDEFGVLDPMDEEHTSPAPCVTQRYPDRVILNITNVCASFCRFCQRRRNFSTVDTHQPETRVLDGIKYIKSTPTIRDVLITGGDPLTLSDSYLEKVIGEVRSIPHVEIIRLGSRLPTTLPQRITTDLCHMLKQFHPLLISTHFNHPLEVTEESAIAASRLADAGILLNNQSVLLRGVNDHPFVYKLLCQLLIKNRIRPYYLFHPKAVKGTAHFACSINDGLRVIQGLRGFTSELAIPTYVYNAPGGLGKIPLAPDYVVSDEEDGLVLRTWEGQQVYPLPPGKRTCLCSGRTRCDPAKQTRSSQSGTEA